MTELLAAGGVEAWKGEITVVSFRALPMDFKASWNGSTEDGWATLTSASFLIVVGAFLKLGSFGLGFGAEKKEESDLASFTAVTEGFVSFFTLVAGRAEEIDATAGFFVGGPAFDGGSESFRFFDLPSTHQNKNTTTVIRSDMTHPQLFLHHLYWRIHLWTVGAFVAIYVRGSMPYP
jgi:hypothetical protein